MKTHFQMTLTDLSPEMLELSRTINPELEHVQGDMLTIRLGRQFDAVFVHDAVVYLTTEEDLAAAMRTAFVHCRPRGAALFAPDYVRETFRPGTDHGGHDGPDGRGLRYLEWIHEPNPNGTTYTVDYAYLLREADGSARVEHDRHIEGLFPRDTWLRLLSDASFQPRAVHVEHAAPDPCSAEVFVAIKPP